MEFAEEEESDTEEGTRHPYKKHQWTLLEAWSNIKIKGPLYISTQISGANLG